MSMDLALILAGVIAFAVTLYVLLDGFSLGIGILFPFAPAPGDRDVMMTSVAPVWDGNQTWLVLGGTCLFAAFPLAFGLLLSVFYTPLIIMLIALVFRGVSFEFRFKSSRPRAWDIAFSAGSMLAAGCQGLVLGAYVQGIALHNGVYVGGLFDWLSAFSGMTAAAVICAYALLGCCWLIIKTEGALQEWARRTALTLWWVILSFIVVVSVWTPLSEPAIAARWFTWPGFLFLAPIPLMTAALALALRKTLRDGRIYWPFLLCVALYLLTLGGLAISLWPYIVPRQLDVWQAAAPPESQLFILVGIAVIIPFVLAYSAHSYYVFRGKVKAEDAYH